MEHKNLPEKKRILLRPEHILRFFITEDSRLDDLIIFHHDQFELMMTDVGLYEALGSLKEYDDFKKAKLVKLLEVTRLIPSTKILLTHDRVEQVRKLALKEEKK